MKITSNKLTADDAISKVVDVKNNVVNDQQIEFSYSNISGMANGAEISNQMVDDASQLVNCVFIQANKISQLAALIEQRDKQDGASWQ